MSKGRGGSSKEPRNSHDQPPAERLKQLGSAFQGFGWLRPTGETDSYLWFWALVVLLAGMILIWFGSATFELVNNYFNVGLEAIDPQFGKGK